MRNTYGKGVETTLEAKDGANEETDKGDKKAEFRSVALKSRQQLGNCRQERFHPNKLKTIIVLECPRGVPVSLDKSPPIFGNGYVPDWPVLTRFSS